MFFGGQPTAEALRAAPGHGVSTVVNLRTAREMTEQVGFDEPALVERLGLEYIHLPVTRATFSARSADELAGILTRLQAGQAAAGGNAGVLIHCASSNRVGALWALYLARHHDLPLEDAIERGRRAGLRSAAAARMVRDAMAGVEPTDP